MKKKLNCILLIDDDEATNYFTRIILEEANCTEHIQVEESGQAAMNYLTRSAGTDANGGSYPSPDLIFVDINMPAMTGWEFMEHYSALQKEQKGKIVMVMLTTSLNPDDKQRAGDVNDIAGFETKPLNADKLQAILQRYFPERFDAG